MSKESNAFLKSDTQSLVTAALSEVQTKLMSLSNNTTFKKPPPPPKSSGSRGRTHRRHGRWSQRVVLTSCLVPLDQPPKTQVPLYPSQHAPQTTVRRVQYTSVGMLKPWQEGDHQPKTYYLPRPFTTQLPLSSNR